MQRAALGGRTDAQNQAVTPAKGQLPHNNLKQILSNKQRSQEKTAPQQAQNSNQAQGSQQKRGSNSSLN